MRACLRVCVHLHIVVDGEELSVCVPMTTQEPSLVCKFVSLFLFLCVNVSLWFLSRIGRAFFANVNSHS